MQNTKVLALFAMLITLLLSACNEDDDSMPSTDEVDEQTIQNVLYSQSQFDEALVVADEALTSSSVRSNSEGLCADISLDTATQTLILDFGEGCTSSWGRERAGKITIEYERITLFQGVAYSMTFDNYVSEGVTLNGTVSVDGFTRDNDGNLFYKVEVINGSLEFPDGEVIRHSSSRTFTWIEGEGTRDVTDNIFELTGSLSGTTIEDVNYTASLETPLILDTNCFENGYAYASSATIIIGLSTLTDDITVDFGDGTCDAEATYTYRGRTETIDLR